MTRLDAIAAFDRWQGGDKAAGGELLEVARKIAFTILARQGVVGPKAEDLALDGAIKGLLRWRPDDGALGSSITWSIRSIQRHQQRRASLEVRSLERLAVPVANESAAERRRRWALRDSVRCRLRLLPEDDLRIVQKYLRCGRLRPVEARRFREIKQRDLAADESLREIAHA